MNDFVVKEDGFIEIPIIKSGLPSATALFPTIAFKAENRLTEVERQLDVLALQGKWVEGWKWIRNPLFDREGQKTTAEIKFRMCKNINEADMVACKIKEILKAVNDANNKSNWKYV